MRLITPTEAARQLPERQITVFAHTEGQPTEQVAETLRTLGRPVTLHEVTLSLGDEGPKWLPPIQDGREKQFRVVSPAKTRAAGLGFALLSTVQGQGANVLAVPHPSFPEAGSADADWAMRQLGVTTYNAALAARDRAAEIGFPLWLVVAGSEEALHVVSPLVTGTADYAFQPGAPAPVL